MFRDELIKVQRSQLISKGTPPVVHTTKTLSTAATPSGEIQTAQGASDARCAHVSIGPAGAGLHSPRQTFSGRAFRSGSWRHDSGATPRGAAFPTSDA